MNTLFTYLESFYPLSDGLKEHIAALLKSKELLKKAFLLKAGHTCRNVYFIEQGLLRCYYLKESQEVNTWFMKEGDVVISVESFYKQQPGSEYIQALEDCRLFYITYSELQHIYHHYIEFNVVGRKLTENYYMLSEQRLASLRQQRAQERYGYLWAHHPELIQRVPAKYIASYLSISVETLSRIRSKKWIY